MLQEVGQAGLIVFFLHGAHLLSDIKIGSVLRLSIIPDVIG